MSTKILKLSFEAPCAMPPENTSHAAILRAVEANQTMLEVMSRKQMDFQRAHERIELALGHLPDSDGKTGSGLLGDVAKLQREVQSFLDLINGGRGFLLSLKIFGVVILGGIAYWITHLFESPKS